MLPQIIAHRGASAEAPENTLAAIELAWRQQADGVEIDIHLTADGQVVAIHDSTLLRTTGRDAAVAASDLALIRTLDAGHWKGAAFAGQRVPTLQEVLATVPAGRRLLIEIKGERSGGETASTAAGRGPRPHLVTALAEAILAGPVPAKDTVLICFDALVLHAARQALPAAPALHLAGGETGTRLCTREDLERLIAQANRLGFEGLNLGQNWRIDPALVSLVHRSGLTCWVWTVNEEGHAGYLADCGVDGLTTDRPARLRDYLRRRQIAEGLEKPESGGG